MELEKGQKQADTGHAQKNQKNILMIENGIGVSQNTIYKQDIFRQFVRNHINIAEKVITKNSYYNRNYWYFDLNAGAGVYQTEDGINIKGSPIIFAEEALKHPKLHFHLVLIERNEKNFSTLRNNLIKGKNLWYETHCEDHNNVLLQYGSKGSKRIGLAYTDPSGNRPPFDLLAKFNLQYIHTTIDLLIHMSATNLKRIIHSPGCKDRRNLNDYLSILHKKHWQVSDGKYRHQWTFLFGCQWTQFAEMKKIGMRLIDTPEGKQIIHKLTKTTKESYERTYNQPIV